VPLTLKLLIDLALGKPSLNSGPLLLVAGLGLRLRNVIWNVVAMLALTSMLVLPAWTGNPFPASPWSGENTWDIFDRQWTLPNLWISLALTGLFALASLSLVLASRLTWLSLKAYRPTHAAPVGNV
jgi:hypothetical protein